jgi:hypothetical protein
VCAGGSEYPVRVARHAEPGPGTSPQDKDLVIGVLVGDEARAYPLNLLWHETAHTVNDELGRAPIAVALCPLAGVGTAFSRRRGRDELELGHVSEVERDTLVLYDRATHSRWGLLTGEAFEGPLTGRRLDRLPVLQTTWGRWRTLHPRTTVYVAPDQAEMGFELDDQKIRRVVLAGAGAPRRSDWVLGLTAGREAAAVVLRGLAKDRALNETLAGRPIVVFLTSDLTTALAWGRQVAGRTLTFSASADTLVDPGTASSWDAVTGKGISGPLARHALEPVPGTVTAFWHAWQAHHPDTRVLGLARD